MNCPYWSGLISPREVARLAGREPDLSLLGPEARPRVVSVNTEKICQVTPMPETYDSVAAFVTDWLQQSPALARAEA